MFGTRPVDIPLETKERRRSNAVALIAGGGPPTGDRSFQLQRAAFEGATPASYRAALRRPEGRPTWLLTTWCASISTPLIQIRTRASNTLVRTKGAMAQCLFVLEEVDRGSSNRLHPSWRHVLLHGQPWRSRQSDHRNAKRTRVRKNSERRYSSQQPACKAGVQAMARKNPLDGRARDNDGEVRRKRGDTLIGTLRGEYPGFAPGVRADMRLDNYLDREGLDSLSNALRNQR